MSNKQKSTPAQDALPIPEIMPEAQISEVELEPQDAAKLLQIHAEEDQAFMARMAEERLEAKDRTNMVQVNKVIDPHEGRLATVLKVWVEVTPSLCIDCGYDAAVAIGYGRPDPLTGKTGWHRIPETLMFDSNRSVRDFALSTLERHKSIRHPGGKSDRIKTRAEVKAIKNRPQLPEGFVTNPKI